MAFVPAVTNITSRVSFPLTASIIIDAVRNHINSGDTTHLQIDAYTANEGLTIGFVDVAESHQVNFRKNAASDIAISIEPSGSITDPGDSTPTAPTGTSADWSGVLQEPTWTVTLSSGAAPASGSKVWIVECVDAFFIMITDPTNTFQTSICHAGRIAVSLGSANAASVGQDGLGYVAGVPDNGNGTSNDWFGTSSPCSSIHWGTNEWCTDIGWDTIAADSRWPDAADVTVRFMQPLVFYANDINGTSSDGVYGVSKYIRGTGSATAMDQKQDSLSNQSWLNYNDAASQSLEAIIWDKTVTP